MSNSPRIDTVRHIRIFDVKMWSEIKLASLFEELRTWSMSSILQGPSRRRYTLLHILASDCAGKSMPWVKSS